MAKVRRRQEVSRGNVSVSGPGFEKGGYANLSVGISAALTAATRGEDGRAWYVREGDVIKRAVEKRGRTIVVLKTGGA